MLGRFAVLLPILAAAACAASPVGPIGSISLTAPTYLAPANGERILFASQPVTLVVHNGAASNDGAQITYHVEVATEPSFTNPLITQDIGAGPDDRTGLTLGPLTPGQYFWRVRADAGGGSSPFTQPISFTIVN